MRRALAHRLRRIAAVLDPPESPAVRIVTRHGVLTVPRELASLDTLAKLAAQVSGDLLVGDDTLVASHARPR
jgi:hypothetical protein